MDKGIFDIDCAFIVIVYRRSVSFEFTHLFTSFGGLSLRRKIRSIAGYHHEL